MSWRFFATTLDGKGGESPLEPEIPFKDVEVTHVLSGPDVIKGTLSPGISRLVGQDGRPVFVPWLTAIYAEKDGIIRAGGIVTDLNSENEKLEVEAHGFSGYLDDMPYTDTFSGVELDPFDIARMIWKHVQSKPNGDIGLKLNDDKTQVKIGRKADPNKAATSSGSKSDMKDSPFELSWYQTSNLMDTFNKVAEATPFDYQERHRWVDVEKCIIEHRLEMVYPRIGRRREDLRFVVGENVFEAPKLTEDGKFYASEVWVLGAGEGSVMTHGVATDTKPGRLRRVSVVTAKDVMDNNVASSVANNELRYRNGRIDFSEIVVTNTDFAQYGDLQVGDEIYVQTQDEWYSGRGEWVRVIELSVKPTDSDTMTLLVLREDTD